MRFIKLTFLPVFALLFSYTYAFGAPHYYTINVDYALSRLTVEARYSEAVDSIRARSRKASRFVLDARGCEDNAKIRIRSRRLLLPDDGIECLKYTVDLDRAAKEYRGARNLSSQNIVVSPSLWMWRPTLDGEAEIRVQFQLPENTQVSVPWKSLNGDNTLFAILESPESASAPAVFGRFDYREITVPGSTLRLTMLAGKSAMNHAAVANWIRATATDVSLTYGRFPNPSPQVVVVPVSSGRGTVAFGRVVRDGGETVELLINPDGDTAEMFTDWTATHEFSHMLLPYLDSSFHWISEGFSQYYQNILLTRSGAYDAQKMWQKLYSGFERGRKSSPELSPNEATGRSGRNSRMKVYWSGAALALMADVALRERSDGAETLDDVLDRLQLCCLPSSRTWTGPEFFAKLDTLVSEPLFTELYRRYADTAGFPDTSEIYARLGLSVADDTVSILPTADLLSIREAMTVTHSPTAEWRDRLATDD
ncbi:MAG: hypothetical protein ACR2Q3_00810 [Woeseiaceae bacterium]